MYWYLAGPFFNQQSREVLYSLLKVLEDRGHQVFAPMRNGILCPKDASYEERVKVFRLDIGKIDKSDGMLALLDYPLPPEKKLLMQVREGEGQGKIVDFIDVSLPDSGTLIEMGYAFREYQVHKKFSPIIGYSTSEKGFNLMVAQLCTCIVMNLDELNAVLDMVEKQDLDNLARLKETGTRKLQEF